MALSSTRIEYRIALSHVDRGIEMTDTVIAALHPSETAEHLTLRALSYCLLYQDRIEFGPGLGDPEAADLWAHDLTGRLSLWVECGTASGDKLRKVVQHNSGAAVHAVFGSDRRRQDLLDEVAGWPRVPKGLGAIELWTVDAALLGALAARDQRRHRWTVTIVGDHFYIDADGENLDGAIGRGRPPG